MSNQDDPRRSWQEAVMQQAPLLRPFFAADWVAERAVYRLRKMAFVELLDVLARFSLIVAVFSYCWGGSDRKRNEHNAAWQTLNSAQGKPGNGGRIDALEHLVEDRIALDGIDLRYAWLQRAKLAGAQLSHAKLDSADLSNADLRGAFLFGASMKRTILRGADLRGAHLAGANLEIARMEGADLRSMDLRAVNLRGAKLCYADLSRVRFDQYTKLDSADLRRANLWRSRWPDLGVTANFREANLAHIVLESHVENLQLRIRTVGGAVLADSGAWEKTWKDALRWRGPTVGCEYGPDAPSTPRKDRN